MYRLRLPKTALTAIEQIVICKMMLFSYLYHHPKVRASEGLFERMLGLAEASWRKTEGMNDQQVLRRYLELTDSSLRDPLFLKSPDEFVREYAYRIINRLLPREVGESASTQPRTRIASCSKYFRNGLARPKEAG